MKLTKNKIIIICSAAALVIVAAIVLILVLGHQDQYRVVKVENYDGEIAIDRTSNNTDVDIFKGMNLLSGDKVSVGDSSNLEMLMDTDKHMLAEANTTFKLITSGSAEAGRISIDIINGSSLFEIENKLGDNSFFDVHTPNAVFSVRGTEFRVSYNEADNETTLEVYDGVVAIEYENSDETEDVSAGAGKVIGQDQSYDIAVSIADNDSSADASSNTGSDSTGNSASDNSDSGNHVAGSGDTGASGSGNSSGYAWQKTTNITNDSQLLAGYNEIIAHMADYLAENTKHGRDYISRDYMYFDYDGDGQNELILYAGFNDENSEFMRDVVFLDYNEATQSIYTLAVNYDEHNDESFYAEYDGKMARYFWTHGSYDSYLYLVSVHNGLVYVLEKSYDHLVVDLESEGMHPIPLYGDWEMLFN